LEPLSFTLTNFNCEYRYHSESWRVLGYVPDLEMKSTAYKTKQKLGLVGKGRSCRNYHTCLKHILESLKIFKARMKSLENGFGLEIMFHMEDYFFQLLLLLEILRAKIKCVEDILLMPMCLELEGHVM